MTDSYRILSGKLSNTHKCSSYIREPLGNHTWNNEQITEDEQEEGDENEEGDDNGEDDDDDDDDHDDEENDDNDVLDDQLRRR